MGDTDGSAGGSGGEERTRSPSPADRSRSLSPIVESRSRAVSIGGEAVVERSKKRRRELSSPEVGGAQKKSDNCEDESVVLDLRASLTFTAPALPELPSSTTSAVIRDEASEMGDDERPRAKFDLRSALAETNLSSKGTTTIPDGTFVDSVKEVFGRMVASRELHTLYSDVVAFEKGVMRGKLRGLLGLQDMILGRDDRLKEEWKQGVKQLCPILHGIYLGHLNRVLAETEAKLQEAMDERLVYYMEHDGMSEQAAAVRCSGLVRRIAIIGNHFASARMTAALSTIQMHKVIDEVESPAKQPSQELVPAEDAAMDAAEAEPGADGAGGAVASVEAAIGHVLPQASTVSLHRHASFRGAGGRGWVNVRRNGGTGWRGGRGGERGNGGGDARRGGNNGPDGPWAGGYGGYNEQRGGYNAFNGPRGRWNRGRRW
jgi:hypothetical protein